MTALTVSTDLSRFEYRASSYTIQTPPTPPEIDPWVIQTYLERPGWLRIQVATSTSSSDDVIVTVARGLHEDGEPSLTGVSIEGRGISYNGNRDGLVGAVQVDFDDERDVVVKLDGTAFTTQTAAGSGWTWSQDAQWLVVDSILGWRSLKERWLYTHGSRDVTKYWREWKFASDVSASWQGVALNVDPDAYGDTDATVTPGVPIDTVTGTVPKATKRQPLLLAAFTGGAATGAVLASGVEVVAAAVGEPPMYVHPVQGSRYAGTFEPPISDAYEGLRFDYNVGLLTSPLGLGSERLSARTNNVVVCTRPKGSSDLWRTCLTTTGHGFLVPDPDTDGLSLLSPACHSDDLGVTWASGLPSELPSGLAGQVPDGSQLCAAALGADRTPVLVGTAPSGSGTTVWSLGGDGTTVVTVGTLSVADVGGRHCEPFLWHEDDGTWHIGLFCNGRYREWSGDPGAGAWAAMADCEVPGASDLHWPTCRRDRTGAMVVAGYDSMTANVVTWARPQPGGAWYGPALNDFTATVVQPYLLALDSGQFEVGWRVGTAWCRYRASVPTGPWGSA